MKVASPVSGAVSAAVPDVSSMASYSFDHEAVARDAEVLYRVEMEEYVVQEQVAALESRGFEVLSPLAAARRRSKEAVEVKDSAAGWLSYRQVAERVGLCARTIRRRVDDGLFPAPRIMGKGLPRFDRSEVDAWLASRPRA